MMIMLMMIVMTTTMIIMTMMMIIMMIVHYQHVVMTFQRSYVCSSDGTDPKLRQEGVHRLAVGADQRSGDGRVQQSVGCPEDREHQRGDKTRAKRPATSHISPAIFARQFDRPFDLPEHHGPSQGSCNYTCYKAQVFPNGTDAASAAVAPMPVHRLTAAAAVPPMLV